MGVRVIAASQQIGADARGSMAALGPRIAYKSTTTPYVSAGPEAALFDSVPGIGFNSDLTASAIVPPAGRILATGSSLALDPAANNVFRAINRAWKEGATVQFVAANGSRPARYLIAGLPADRQMDLVRELALVAERTDASGNAVRKPRIGIYEPWGGNTSAGWTRWLLDQYGFEYVTLRPADFHVPLSPRIDVLLMPDGTRLRGGAATSGRTGRGVRPEYVDDTTPDDLTAVEAFVRRGGTFVCISTSCAFPIQQFKLPVINSVSGLRSEEFFLRGSIVEAAIDTSHPVMAGMPATAALFVDGSPVFEIRPAFDGSILARYATDGSPLLSGYLIGEKYLAGKAAALDVPLDSGHVILLGFRPEWRGQPFGTFRVLFNALLNVH
jgi:hypothetical protein